MRFAPVSCGVLVHRAESGAPANDAPSGADAGDSGGGG